MQNRTAIYLRLSKEDDGENRESESITSQRILLRQYAAVNHLQIVSEFTDDGVSGLQRERPALKEMLRAAERGWFRILLIKDLSRLSRDYIRTGELLEYWFPAHGIRLIAVNDRIDTGTGTDDFSAFRALMNDWYTRDISRKVRAAISARQLAGFCTLATVPFGYQRTGSTLTVRQEQAETVRDIFERYLNGQSCSAIAADLTRAGIQSPRRSAKGWSDTSVRRILTNPVCTGRLMLHTTEKTSYKCSKMRRRNPEEAVIFTVPPIISLKTFSAVQSCIQKNGHRHKPKHWLSGIAFCGQCGALMTVSAANGMRLICAGRRRKNGCSNPSMRIDDLENGLLSAIRSAGIPACRSALPYLVESLQISAETASVSLRCRQPAPACTD